MTNNRKQIHDYGLGFIFIKVWNYPIKMHVWKTHVFFYKVIDLNNENILKEFGGQVKIYFENEMKLQKPFTKSY